MNKKKTLFISLMLFCFALLHLGCEPYKVESIEELEEIAYNPPEEFKQVVTQGDFEFTLIYQPFEILLLNEIKYLVELQDKGASEEQIERQEESLEQYRMSFENLIQYKLIISPIGDEDLIYSKLGQGFDSYSAWLQKLLFGIQEEIALVTPNDVEVPLISYQMDRNYGVSTSRSFLLTFPKEWEGIALEGQKNLQLEIGEFGLGTGKVIIKQNLPFPEITLQTILNNPQS